MTDLYIIFIPVGPEVHKRRKAPAYDEPGPSGSYLRLQPPKYPFYRAREGGAPADCLQVQCGRPELPRPLADEGEERSDGMHVINVDEIARASRDPVCNIEAGVPLWGELQAADRVRDQGWELLCMVVGERYGIAEEAV